MQVLDTQCGLANASREEVLTENIPLVRYVAKRIHQRLPKHVEFDDLVSAGMTGLIDAYSKFDRQKMVQFKSYARFRINGAILDSLRTLDWGSRSLRRKAREVEAARQTLTHRLGCSPSDQQMAEFLGTPLRQYQLLLGDLCGLEIGALDFPRNKETGEDIFATISGSEEYEPYSQAVRAEVRQRVAAAVDDLPEKERLVLTLYYQEELTMKEVGLALGVVESRVSQIHHSAVMKLRSVLSDFGGERRSDS